MTIEIELRVNGIEHRLEIEPHRSLGHLLNQQLGLSGVRLSCEEGECGTCTVLLDGRPVRSCLMLAVACENRDIVTIEGLEKDDGRLDPVQESFVLNGAIQCGYCTPGMILTGKSLLAEKPDPSEAEVRRAISGNLCRCTGYNKIVDAIMKVPKGGNGSDPGKKPDEPRG